MTLTIKPRVPSRIDYWEPFIAEASRRFALPEDWIRNVMRIESGGQTTLDGLPITSSAGATGLVPILSIRATIFWQARPICARCSTASAETDSLLPTTPVRSVIPTI